MKGVNKIVQKGINFDGIGGRMDHLLFATAPAIPFLSCFIFNERCDQEFIIVQKWTNAELHESIPKGLLLNQINHPLSVTIL